MTKPSFQIIWTRIVAHQGEVFYTKGGLNFKYRIRNNYFYPSRTAYSISKKEFEKAYDKVPLEGPGKIAGIVRGPSYVWAVLHDQRISLGQW